MKKKILLFIIIKTLNIIPHISSYSISPLIGMFSLFFLSLKNWFKIILFINWYGEEDEPSLSCSSGNSSERHSLRRKLCNPAQARTNSACVSYGNGGAILKIVNRDLNIPNILSIVEK